MLLNYTKKTGWGGGATGEYYGLYPGSIGSGYYASYKSSDESLMSNCASPSSLDCTILLHRNNWKFSKDYPIDINDKEEIKKAMGV